MMDPLKFGSFLLTLKIFEHALEKSEDVSAQIFPQGDLKLLFDSSIFEEPKHSSNTTSHIACLTTEYIACATYNITRPINQHMIFSFTSKSFTKLTRKNRILFFCCTWSQTSPLKCQIMFISKLNKLVGLIFGLKWYWIDISKLMSLSQSRK